jgi:hypothetical protein
MTIFDSIKGEQVTDGSARVKDVFEDGQEVVINMMENVAIDEVGAPVLSEFQKDSFCNDCEATNGKLAYYALSHSSYPYFTNLNTYFNLINTLSFLLFSSSSFSKNKTTNPLLSFLFSFFSVRLSAEKAREAGRKADQLQSLLDKKRLKEMENRRKFVVDGGLVGSMAEFEVGVTGMIDWPEIEAALSSNNHSQKEIDELREYFPDDVFPILSEIFTHYVGPLGSGDSSGGLSFVEFSHFVHDCKLYHALRDVEALAKFFSAGGGEGSGGENSLGRSGGDDGEGNDNRIRRGNFMAAVVLLCVAKAEGVKRTATAVREVIDDAIQPMVDTRGQSKVRKLIAETRIGDILNESRPYLVEVFDHFCAEGYNNSNNSDNSSSWDRRGGGGGGGSYREESKGGESKDGGSDRNNNNYSGLMMESEKTTMDLDTFTKICKDSGLLHRNPGESGAAGEERMAKIALNAFFAAQYDPPRQLELERLVFAEFIEATFELSLDSLAGTDGDFQKVQLGMDALLDLRRNILR